MTAYAAHLIGPAGDYAVVYLLADSPQHARSLARDEGRRLFGPRPFTYTVHCTQQERRA